MLNLESDQIHLHLIVKTQKNLHLFPKKCQFVENFNENSTLQLSKYTTNSKKHMTKNWYMRRAMIWNKNPELLLKNNVKDLFEELRSLLSNEINDQKYKLQEFEKNEIQLKTTIGT